MKVLRKGKISSGVLASDESNMEHKEVLPLVNEEGKDGAKDTTEELEEESDGEEWEEISGYLPPFPKTDKEKTGVCVCVCVHI